MNSMAFLLEPKLHILNYLYPITKIFLIKIKKINFVTKIYFLTNRGEKKEDMANPRKI